MTLESFADEFHRAGVENAVQISALIALLVMKGVFTPAEFDEMKARVSPMIDQLAAELRDAK